MPELPEVETLCRQLDAALKGAVFKSLEIDDPKITDIFIPDGSRVLSVRRSGKSVAIHFETDGTLVIQLRMTGRLIWTMDRTRLAHGRCVFIFDTGCVHLADPRRFAVAYISHSNGQGAAALDPMEERDGRDYMIRSAGRHLPVKHFLMDQKTIGGIGNIYACEALHRAGISPWRRACDLDEKRWRRLSKALKAILTKAIDSRGTTVSDWTDLFNMKGSYQRHLRVYGREGKPCPRCGAPVIRTRLGGRATYFCTSCQET